MGRGVPAREHDDHVQEGDGVEEEHRGRPRYRDNEACQCRAHRAGEVVGDAAQGDRLGQFIGRNEFRVDRLPGWIRQDRAEAKHEGEAE